MKGNKILRFVLVCLTCIGLIMGIVLAILFFTEVITGTLGIVLLVVGAVFLLTSIVGFCLLYAPFGIRTCPKK